jgi:D-alanine transaminase
MSRVSLDNPMSSDQWNQVFQSLLEKNPGGDRAIYLQVTRGAAPIRDLSIAAHIKPTVFIMVNDIKPVDYTVLERGIEAITVEDFRWKACDIKSVSLIANVMIRLQANQSSAVDAVMVRDGLLTEGTASNVFVVHDGVIATPPKSDCLLPGITRDLVIELARADGMKVEERDINEDELESADEIWLTSSTREIAPVVKINDQIVGEGMAGEYWKRIIAIYQRYKQELRNG